MPKINKKYVIIPGWVQSKNDGDWHYISTSQLIRLYNVRPSECIFGNNTLTTEKIQEELIILAPRYNGNYNLP